MAVKNSSVAASSSLGTGMYSAAYNDTKYHTDFLKTKTEQSIGSTFIARNNIDININKDYNQTGSILKSNKEDKLGSDPYIPIPQRMQKIKR